MFPLSLSLGNQTSSSSSSTGTACLLGCIRRMKIGQSLSNTPTPHSPSIITFFNHPHNRLSQRFSLGTRGWSICFLGLCFHPQASVSVYPPSGHSQPLLIPLSARILRWQKHPNACPFSHSFIMKMKVLTLLLVLYLWFKLTFVLSMHIQYHRLSICPDSVFACFYTCRTDARPTRAEPRSVSAMVRHRLRGQYQRHGWWFLPVSAASALQRKRRDSSVLLWLWGGICAWFKGSSISFLWILKAENKLQHFYKSSKIGFRLHFWESAFLWFFLSDVLLNTWMF